MLVELSNWVTEVIDRLGYVGVATLVALENLCPPIPSEVVLPFAGFSASDAGGGSLVAMIVAATIGSVAGAWALYGISAAIGRERLLALVARHGRWLRLTTADVIGAEEWFDRHADIAVLVGRCVPLVRSLISIPAGFRRMRFRRFTVLTIAGSTVWNSGLILTGYALRERWEEVEPAMSIAQYVVLALLAAAVARYAACRFVRPLLTGARTRHRPRIAPEAVSVVRDDGGRPDEISRRISRR